MLEEDELMHYGVLGMKWGVRKDRSSGSGKKKSKKNSKSKKSVTHKNTKTEITSLTNEELRLRIERLKLEREYNSFYPKQIGAGRKFVEDLMDKTLSGITKGTEKAVTAYTDSTLRSMMGMPQEQKKKKKDDD